MIRACLHSAAVITTNLPPSQFLILLQLLMQEMSPGPDIFFFFTAVYTTEGQVYTWTATTPSTVTPVTFSTGSVMDAADCE
jgi:hypothetical protein